MRNRVRGVKTQFYAADAIEDLFTNFLKSWNGTIPLA